MKTEITLRAKARYNDENNCELTIEDNDEMRNKIELVLKEDEDPDKPINVELSKTDFLKAIAHFQED